MMGSLAVFAKNHFASFCYDSLHAACLDWDLSVQEALQTDQATALASRCFLRLSVCAVVVLRLQPSTVKSHHEGELTLNECQLCSA